MRVFTNPKALELYYEAEILEQEARNLIVNRTILSDRYAELMTEAAGLRVLADDIEDGRISEETLEDV